MTGRTQRVEFQTVDGTILRGDLTLPSVHNAPVVILVAGVSSFEVLGQILYQLLMNKIQLTFLKEHGIPSYTAVFNKAGYATLAYDHRNWGSSDGTPRQHTNLFQQAEDMSDAVTYVINRPEIDGTRVAVWGIGHGAGVAIQCGAHDKRVQAVMGTGPFFSGEIEQLRFPPGALEAAWKERIESIGKPKKIPIYVPIFAESAEAAEASPLASIIGSPQGYMLWEGGKPASDAAGTPWENKLTLESLYWQSKFEPTAVINQISPRPFFWTLQDAPLLPHFQSQLAAYEKARQPKEFQAFRSLEEGFGGPAWDKNVAVQLDFLKRYV
jgi:pimeloyl-ACP methyl ester carboxylesterase